MSDWIKTAKSSSQIRIVSPRSQRDFTIRKLSSSELLEAGITPLINADNKPNKIEDPAAANAAALAWLAMNSDRVTLAQTRHVLLNGVVTPKLVYEEAAVNDEETVCVRWISEDEEWLYLSVLEFSGHSSEAHKQRMAELLKNENGSGLSTSSAENTGNSHTN